MTSNPNEYILFTDRRFSRHARKEIKKIILDATTRRLATLSGFEAIKIVSNLSHAQAMEKISPGLIFSYGLLPIDANVSNVDNLDKTTKEIAKLLSQNKKHFRIEVKKLGYHSELKAKSIEVLLGNALEKLGFTADLKDPEIMIYIFLFESNSVVSLLPSSVYGIGFLDMFRLNKDKKVVSRAEFKLEEALRRFRIKVTKNDKVIDVGAAPGGWTHALASRGANVFAIDAAKLNYISLSECGNMLVLSNDAASANSISEVELKKDLPTDWPNYKIIHLKANASNVFVQQVLRKAAPFTMLVLDVNMSPSDASSIPLSFLQFLKPDAIVIMTLKLVDWHVQKHIEAIKQAMEKEFYEIKIAKMTYNRAELTLCAKSKPHTKSE